MADVITVTIPDLPAIAEPAGDELVAVWQGNRLGRINQGALRGSRTFSGPSDPPTEPTAIMALQPIRSDRWRNSTTGDEWKVTSLTPFVWSPDGNLKGEPGVSDTPGPPGEPGKPGGKGDKGEPGKFETAIAAAAIPNETVLVDNGFGSAVPADPSNPAHSGKVLGFAKIGAPNGGTVTYQVLGAITNLATTFGTGVPLYISSTPRAGALTATAPSAVGYWSQRVATASSADSIVFALGLPGIIDDGLALVVAANPATATQTANGLMSSADKVKVDGLQTALDARAPVLSTLVANGTTDDRTALSVADALQGFGEWLLKPGTIRISSNITLAAHYRFPRGVKLKPDSGVTVTFTVQPTAGNYQIFDLSAGGSIAGLAEARVDWFHSLKDTGQDCIPLTQKAYDAVVESGVVRWGAGTYTCGGGVIVASKGQSSLGHGGRATKIRWSTGVTNFIRFSGNAFGHQLRDFNMRLASESVRATSGIAIDVQQGGSICDFFDIVGAWEAYSVRAGSTHRVTNFTIQECRFSGVFIKDAIELQMVNFIISSVVDTATFTNQVGTFQPGEVLRYAGNPYNGFYSQNLGGGKHRVRLPMNDSSITGGTVTGQNSGATATLSVMEFDFYAGAIRTEGNVEAFNAMIGDVIGGGVAMSMNGTANLARATSTCFSKFTNVLFDSAHAGVGLNGVAQVEFVNCWSVNNGNSGFTLVNTNGIKIINSDIGGNENWGVLAFTNNKNWEVSGCNIFLNQNAGGVTTQSTGNLDFSISRNRFNVDFAQPGNVQGYGVLINANSADYFWIKENSARGMSVAGIVDNSTGNTKFVGENFV